MPLRPIAWLCAVILVVLGGAAPAAAADGARWQAVLAAGDLAGQWRDAAATGGAASFGKC